ncbi:MAG: DUF1559 domain-containing protein [Pirellulales bacterium]|nr:DUF1559 domain-containing protein [Pirellulales bacterium]
MPAYIGSNATCPWHNRLQKSPLRNIRFIKRPRRAFTLVELLVVIAIIGVLVALLLPAVQAARETARRAQCQNNLKQIALGFHNHISAQQHFPAGGWEWRWTGDPDRGFGKEQPGSWIYNILPYIEQASLHDLGAGQQPEAKALSRVQLMQTPLAMFICPSRRSVQTYPDPGAGLGIYNAASRPTPVAKTDYVANNGTQNVCPCNFPSSLERAEASWFRWQPETRGNTGIMNQRSVYRLAEVTDGTSYTLMIGEKYSNPDMYETGEDFGDDHSMYNGWDPDNVRWLFAGNRLANYWPDRPGYADKNAFGSRHSSGGLFAFCDGSVRVVSFDTSQETLLRLAHRSDGEVVDGDSL